MFRTFGLGLVVVLLSASAASAVPTCTGNPWRTLANGAVANADYVMDNFNCLAISPAFSGNVAIGGTSTPGVFLYVTGDPGYTSGYSSGINSTPNWGSAQLLTAAGSAYDNYFNLSGVGAVTVPIVNAYQANGGSVYGSVSVTNYTAFNAHQWPDGSVTNKYAFRASGVAGANNYGAYIDYAKSYFGGEVGIGTTTPVSNSGYGGVSLNGSTGSIYSAMSNGTEIGRYGATASSVFLQSAASMPIIFSTQLGSTELMRMTSSRDFGFGTTSPVSHDSAAAATIQIGANYVLQNVIGNQLLLGNNVYYDSTGTWKYISTAAASALRQYSGDIAFHAAPSGTAGTTPPNWDTTAVRMIVKNSGNVGIGTSSPTGNLDVYGSGNVNGVSISGNTSTNAPTIASAGTPTDLGLTFQSKGAGNIDLKTGGNTQLRVANFASATDYLQIAGGNSANAVTIQAGGTDSAISLWLASKGGGTIFFATGGLRIASMITTSTPANFPTLQANNAGGPAQLFANGTDTNVDLRLSARGTGSLDLWTSTRQARVIDTASAVDYLTFTGGTSGTVTIGANGTSSNTSVQISPKGTGNVVLNAQTKVVSLASASGTHLCIDGSNIIASCSSSIRYKENVHDAAFGLKEVLALRPVTFKWKGRDEKDFGFIAEETAKINPLFATYRDGKIEGVKYPQLTSLLVNAVKELKVANDNQAAELRNLRAVNERQAAEIRALHSRQAAELKQMKSAIWELRRVQQTSTVRTAQRY